MPILFTGFSGSEGVDGGCGCCVCTLSVSIESCSVTYDSTYTITLKQGDTVIETATAGWNSTTALTSAVLGQTYTLVVVNQNGVTRTFTVTFDECDQVYTVFMVDQLQITNFACGPDASVGYLDDSELAPGDFVINGTTATAGTISYDGSLHTWIYSPAGDLAGASTGTVRDFDLSVTVTFRDRAITQSQHNNCTFFFNWVTDISLWVFDGCTGTAPPGSALPLPGVTVDLRVNGVPAGSTSTGPDGVAYFGGSVYGIIPGDTLDFYATHASYADGHVTYVLPDQMFADLSGDAHACETIRLLTLFTDCVTRSCPLCVFDPAHPWTAGTTIAPTIRLNDGFGDVTLTAGLIDAGDGTSYCAFVGSALRTASTSVTPPPGPPGCVASAGVQVTVWWYLTSTRFSCAVQSGCSPVYPFNGVYGVGVGTPSGTAPGPNLYDNWTDGLWHGPGMPGAVEIGNVSATIDCMVPSATWVTDFTGVPGTPILGYIYGFAAPFTWTLG